MKRDLKDVKEKLRLINELIFEAYKVKQELEAEKQQIENEQKYAYKRSRKNGFRRN